MNDRNVAALQAVIDDLGYGWPDERAKMAKDLAARGVLVPAALSDGDLMAAVLVPVDPRFAPTVSIAALERIATGADA